MDNPYEEEPHLAGKTPEKRANIENNPNEDQKRSPTPKADWGITDEEKGRPETTKTTIDIGTQEELERAIPTGHEGRQESDDRQRNQDTPAKATSRQGRET